MKFSLTALTVVALVAGAKAQDRNDKPNKVVCYWGTWAFYRDSPDGHFQAEDINPNICTHVMYGFAKLVGNKMALFDPDLDTGDTDWHSGLNWGHGMIRRLMNLKNYNKHLTTSISIGGWNEGSDKYSAMVSSPSGRAEFVQSALEFLQTYQFDGLDIDWEYPAMKASGDVVRTPGRDADKADYISLLRELRQAFKPHGYVLSAAVSAGAPTIDRAYDIPEMNKYLDFISLMAYDYHGGFDNKTGHNAPLHALPDATGTDKQFVVDYSVHYWLEKGMDSNKLVLGMPLYGRTFTLAGEQSDIGAPASGSGGNAGPITKIVGMLGYNEICAMVKQGWQLRRNDIQKIPYAVHANQWVGYDDEQSIADKVKFAMDKNLGGAMVWSVDTDDFTGHCGKGKYPLLKTISRMLNNVDGPDVIIPEPHVSTTPDPNNPTQPTQPTQPTHPDDHTDHPDHPTTPDDHHGGAFKCTGPGFFPDPNSKSKFHQCVDFGNGNFKDYPFDCPAGTTYDAVHHICG